jgi:hypothetical protein
MEAALSPTAIYPSETYSTPDRPSRPPFLRTHWELKILVWGLAAIAVAYVITYSATYALAGM